MPKVHICFQNIETSTAHPSKTRLPKTFSQKEENIVVSIMTGEFREGATEDYIFQDHPYKGVCACSTL